MLNVDFAIIKKEVQLQGGGSEKTVLKKIEGAGGYYKKVTFHYATPPEGNTCIFQTTFYLTSENKCFKYISEYWGDKLPLQKINELTKHYPSLKQINKMKWVDNVNRTEITLIQDKQVSAAYSLETKSF